jgi:hypothetical protein
MAGQAESLERDLTRLMQGIHAFKCCVEQRLKMETRLGKQSLIWIQQQQELQLCQEMHTGLFQVPPARMQMLYDFRSGPTC